MAYVEDMNLDTFREAQNRSDYPCPFMDIN